MEVCGLRVVLRSSGEVQLQLKLTVKSGQSFFATVLFTCKELRHTAEDVRACALTPSIDGCITTSVKVTVWQCSIQ